jgi:sugar O-acyltransferase (sialic acid O-acetyltransferase NeuD family)
MNDTVFNKKSKSRLFIIGAGGFGRELESWISRIPNEKLPWILAGFIDDKPDSLNESARDLKYIGTTDYLFHEDDSVIIAIANPDDKEKLYQKMKSKVRFITYIDPTAIIGKYTKIGEGCVICPNSIISANAILGDCVTVNLGSQIGHDAKVGSFSSLMGNVDIGGSSSLGKKCYMGTQSCLTPKIKLGDDITIGIGSVVVNNLVEPGTYFGVPARKIFPLKNEASR